MLASCLLLGSASVEAAIFAKLEGIEGESKVAGREGWMDVEGLGSRVSLNSEVIDGEARMTPKAESFLFHKYIDKASPYLVEALLKGTHLGELQVEQTSGERLVGCYRMRGVSVDLRELQTDGDQLLEQLGFGFDVIEWHYFKQSDDRGEVSHVGTTWDFATGVGGEVEEHGAEAPSIAPISPQQVKPGSTVTLAILLIDPSGSPEKLVLTAQPSENGLVRVTGIEGQGEIRSITLEISPLLNGSDSMTLHVTDGVRSSTRVLPIIIAGDRTSYEAYVEGFLAEEAKLDPQVVGLLRDPDKDRMSNFMEFYLGTDPGEFTRSGEAMSFDPVKVEGGTELRMRFFRRIDTGGLTESFEGTRDFKNWMPLGPTTEPRLEVKVIDNGDGTYATVEATVFVDETVDPELFLRLSVEGTY